MIGTLVSMCQLQLPWQAAVRDTLIMIHVADMVCSCQEDDGLLVPFLLPRVPGRHRLLLRPSSAITSLPAVLVLVLVLVLLVLAGWYYCGSS